MESNLPLIIALLGFIAALLSFISSYMNRKKLSKMEVNIDGRLSQLLETSNKAAHAEGKLEGISEQKVPIASIIATKAEIIADTVIDTHERVKAIEKEVVKKTEP